MPPYGPTRPTTSGQALAGLMIGRANWRSSVCADGAIEVVRLVTMSAHITPRSTLTTMALRGIWHAALPIRLHYRLGEPRNRGQKRVTRCAAVRRSRESGSGRKKRRLEETASALVAAWAEQGHLRRADNARDGGAAQCFTANPAAVG